jgi:predicted acylesterase/phospholipase RssA
MYSNLVLSGGALKAVVLLGAVKYLEEKDLIKHFKNYVGSSAGAIIIFFLIIGYKSYEIKDILIEEINNIVDLDFENIDDFFINYGIDNTDRNKDILKKYLFKKTKLNDITFIEFAKKYGLNFTITGTNLTTRNTDYFNVDNFPNMSMIDALVITSCTPLIYKPIEYNDNLYIDGGIYNNFAYNYYKNKNDSLGINVTYNYSRKNDTFINYFNNILLSLMDKIIELGLDNSENVCFINFDEKRKDGVNISTDDFSVNINNDIIIDNINYGYNTFKEFLNKKIENIKSVDNTQ